MKQYSTSEVAQLVGLHANTIRKYEEWQLIPMPQRQSNGYRVYTDYHVELIKSARLAFAVEIIHGNLRKKIIEVVRSLAEYDFTRSRQLLAEYVQMIEQEQEKAQEAVQLVATYIQDLGATNQLELTRKQVADALGITIDTLRNWEMNGLLTVRRRKNHYRIYGEREITLLKIIRTLRNANYSLSAILRFLDALEEKEQMNDKEIEQTLNELGAQEYIHSVCDTLFVSLKKAKENALKLKVKIDALEEIAQGLSEY